MTLYEINDAIRALLDNAVIDEETGEVTIDEAALAHLQIAREDKLEAYCVVYKECMADSAALKAEAAKLTERAGYAERKAERIKAIVDRELGGEKFRTSKVQVGYRNTTAVEVNDEELFWAWPDHTKYITQKDPTISKKAVGDALKNGEIIPGCRLESRTSMSIK